MSFRELRNLTEMMRALGYPRPVSVENFRTPNFELVSDLLYWMAKKYDPSSSVTEEIDTEEDRITFLSSVTSEFFTKARIRLNPKKLYAADGFAVKELIKVAKVLYEASRIDPSSIEADDEEMSTKSLLGSKLKDAKATRALSAEITDCGAKLYDLLDNELEVREARQNALRFLDTVSSNLESTSEHHFLEKSIKNIIVSVQENVESMERQCSELDAEEKALNAKIKKAQGDLERSEKRLKSLQNVRPAFMDEYEKLEKELERQYVIYCERFRNLDYLQHELDLHNERELKKLQENDRTLKKMQKKFRDDELAILRGEQQDPGDAPLPKNNEDMKTSNQSKKEPEGRRRSKANASVNSSESEEESDESEEEEDIKAKPMAKPQANKPSNASDEDSDEVSVADSGELIDNDDDSGSGSEVESGASKSGSAASESGSDTDQDF
ncbi:clusterin-associated protein 1 [Thraustotheca clavata]|uniref:Clusterin-associated protein 1 n=1 Tax=Thraustotheca clavata TaxID=74557 RepID=A0A1W0A7R5_9STRA|nr:clusterin-associated protein 1 [Thraustotheca clavata]